MLGRLRTLFRRPRGGIRYWEERAARHGAHSVLNLGHTADELREVTERQRAILFPILRQHLNRSERIALDFGCGAGRFTPALAELIGGRAIGVDPIARLLDLAPRGANVEYRLLRVPSADAGWKPASHQRLIPLDDASVEMVWVCLVLGTIVDDDLLRLSCSEIERVLAPRGLLFLVENTAAKDDLRHFRFRAADAYRALFPSCALEKVSEYEDLGEPISVLAGRRLLG